MCVYTYIYIYIYTSPRCCQGPDQATLLPNARNSGHVLGKSQPRAKSRSQHCSTWQKNGSGCFSASWLRRCTETRLKLILFYTTLLCHALWTSITYNLSLVCDLITPCNAVWCNMMHYAGPPSCRCRRHQAAFCTWPGKLLLLIRQASKQNHYHSYCELRAMSMLVLAVLVLPALPRTLPIPATRLHWRRTLSPSSAAMVRSSKVRVLRAWQSDHDCAQWCGAIVCTTAVTTGASRALPSFACSQAPSFPPLF